MNASVSECCSVCHGERLVREQTSVEVRSLFTGDTLTIHNLPVRCPHCSGAWLS